MARELAKKTVGQYFVNTDCRVISAQEEIQPLLEHLFECVEAGEQLSERVDMVKRGVAESIELIGLNNTLKDALTALDNFIKERSKE